MALDKSSSADDSGFLSRWSQRKQALRKGEPLAEPAIASAIAPAPTPVKPLDDELFKPKQPVAGIQAAQSAPDSVAIKEASQPEAKPPAPTMQDVHGLTPQSDFKPFMRADVSPDVKNAAMKQLFKDPHFNTMDMMDVYVDDYSKPDPLPPEMLRKMAVTHFLGFWKEEEEEAARLVAEEKASEEKASEEAAEEKAREDAQANDKETMAQSRPDDTKLVTNEESQALAPAAKASHTQHDHPDLQLQPDDAAGRQGAVPSAG